MVESTQIKISPDELNTVDHFRKGRDTAVLTVMFTDIQGFTRMTEEKGEAYSANVREKHDAILTAEIEKENRGLIVKFIGDAVMAVFAEPSSAVQCALDIQNAMHAFNIQQTELDDINVRIGLHLGQVSVENNLQVDVFGRHVNRAARIESLAEGGQILMSYPVFDSAKGWLGTHANVQWVKHGDYLFKGIDDATTVYEVLNTTLNREPKQPEGAVKTSNTAQRWFWRAATGAVLAGALGVGAWFIAPLLSKAEVSVQNFYAENVWVDDKEKLVLDGAKGDELRLIKNELEKGNHVLHYDVNYITRYYAPISVAAGENFIAPRWEESRLPNMSARLELKDKTQDSTKKSQQFKYIEYKDGQRIEHTADIILTINSKKDTEVTQAYVHDVLYTVTLDGKQVVTKGVQIINPLDAKETTRGASEKPVYQDDFHQFKHKYYASQYAVDFTVTGNLAQYSYLRR